MSSALPVLALAATALILSLVVPRLLPGMHWLRCTPAASLALWQMTSLSGTLAALLTAPATAVALITEGGTVPTFFTPSTRTIIALTVATVMTGGMALRLLISAHTIGSDLRADRRRQRQVIDVVASRADGRLRVLDHPGRSAYCLPGLRSRVVLTSGTIQALTQEQLEAVLAHEHAHNNARHDLMLEFFTVLHLTVPRLVRHEIALAEVRLLIELLADRRAARKVGIAPLGGALAAMAGTTTPSASLGGSERVGDLIVRLQALPSHKRAHASVVPVLLATVVVAALPWALLAWAFWA